MGGTPRFPQFPIRIDPVLIQKMRYIGLENCRSANREIELIVKQHIREYENAYGEITSDDLKRMNDNLD